MKNRNRWHGDDMSMSLLCMQYQCVDSTAIPPRTPTPHQKGFLSLSAWCAVAEIWTTLSASLWSTWDFLYISPRLWLSILIWESSSDPPQNKGSCVESQDNFKGSNGSRFAVGRRRFWLRNESAKQKDQETLVVPSVIFGLGLALSNSFKFKVFWIFWPLSFGKTFQFD